MFKIFFLSQLFYNRKAKAVLHLPTATSFPQVHRYKHKAGISHYTIAKLFINHHVLFNTLPGSKFTEIFLFSNGTKLLHVEKIKCLLLKTKAEILKKVEKRKLPAKRWVKKKDS